jgi:hypothetical protein
MRWMQVTCGLLGVGLLLLVAAAVGLSAGGGPEPSVAYLDRAEQSATRGSDTKCPTIMVKAKDYCQEGTPVAPCPNPCPGNASCTDDCDSVKAGFTTVGGDTNYDGSLEFRGCGLDNKTQQLRACPASCVCANGRAIPPAARCTRNSQQKKDC